jgi:hypothetical protein
MRFTAHSSQAVTLVRFDLAGLQAVGAHVAAAPWQQFSVRKPSKAFMVSNRAA